MNKGKGCAFHWTLPFHRVNFFLPVGQEKYTIKHLVSISCKLFNYNSWCSIMFVYTVFKESFYYKSKISTLIQNLLKNLHKISKVNDIYLARILQMLIFLSVKYYNM